MLLCLSLKSVLFPECFPIVQASPFTQGHSSFLTVWRPTIKQGAKTQRGDPDPYLCTIWGGHLPSLALIFFFKLRSEKFSGSTVFSSLHPLAAGVVNFAWKVIDLGKKKKKKDSCCCHARGVCLHNRYKNNREGWLKRGISSTAAGGERKWEQTKSLLKQVCRGQQICIRKHQFPFFLSPMPDMPLSQAD